jgi:hypothetical protein
VLCTPSGDVRVSDFGLARNADEEDTVFAGTRHTWSLHFAIAMSLEGLRRDHARALKLVKQAQDDVAKAQGGEVLKQYRETVTRILRDAAKNP